uniref:PilL modular protein n=1 Tax=Fulvimarina pelagi TaxID=217511 RepID=A0A0P0ZAG4_9HYPH|nr:PilL modular protein [Fulvimarina pelagi]
MSLLAPVAFDFGDSQPLDSDAGERFAHLVEFEWLDDRHYDFHVHLEPVAAAQAAGVEPRMRRSKNAATAQPGIKLRAKLLKYVKILIESETWEQWNSPGDSASRSASEISEIALHHLPKKRAVQIQRFFAV